MGMEEINTKTMTQTPHDSARIQGENKDYFDVASLDIGKLAMLLIKQGSWRKN